MKKKNILLIAVGLMLSVSLVACKATDKAAELYEHVHTLKEKGCDALSAPAKKMLVAVIKSRIPDYPANGICNPLWVQDVLLKKLDLQGDSDVHNESSGLGFQTDSWYRQMDKPNGSGLLVRAIPANDSRSNRLQHRFSDNSRIRSFVYASVQSLHTRGRIDTRSNLYALMPSIYQETS